MRRSAGIVTAACALGASAIVLPPGLNALSSVTVAQQDPQNFVVALPCSQCAFSKSNLGEDDERLERIDDIFSIQGGSYDVLLNYSVSEDGRSFGYGGKTLMPVDLVGSDGPAYVSQVPSSASIVDVETGLEPGVPVEVTMDWWSMDEISLSSNEGGPTMIEHYIIELNGQTMSLNMVKIYLSVDSEGRIQIEGFDISASRDQLLTAPWRADDEESIFLVPIPEEGVENVPAFDQDLEEIKDDGEDCQMPAALCRFKAMVLGKIDAARHGGCSGRKDAGRFSDGRLPPHMRPHFTRPGHDEMPRPHRGRPHHFHKQPHHRHRHGIMYAIGYGIVVALVPALVGIAVGVTASLVGLVVGRLIGFLWITLVRGGRRGDAGAIVLTEECGDVDPEKEGLIAEMEAPPVYEDAVGHEEAKVTFQDEK